MYGESNRNEGIKQGYTCACGIPMTGLNLQHIIMMIDECRRCAKHDQRSHHLGIRDENKAAVKSRIRVMIGEGEGPRLDVAVQ